MRGRFAVWHVRGRVRLRGRGARLDAAGVGGPRGHGREGLCQPVTGGLRGAVGVCDARGAGVVALARSGRVVPRARVARASRARSVSGRASAGGVPRPSWRGGAGCRVGLGGAVRARRDGSAADWVGWRPRRCHRSSGRPYRRPAAPSCRMATQRRRRSPRRPTLRPRTVPASPTPRPRTTTSGRHATQLLPLGALGHQRPRHHQRRRSNATSPAPPPPP